MSETSAVSRFLPVLRYRNLPRAIDWLSRAFGFEKYDIITAVDGTIRRAQLKFGREMILLLPVRNADRPTSRPPEEIGDELQSYYFIVDDAEEHCDAAKAAGAEVIEIMEYDDGGRGYSCRDLEGHVWNFVTYDSPLTRAAPGGDAEEAPPETTPLSNSLLVAATSMPSKVTRLVLVTVVGTVIATAVAGLWFVTVLQSTDTGSQVSRRTHTDRLPTRAAADTQRSVLASEGADRPQPTPTPSSSVALSTTSSPKHDEGGVGTAPQPNAPVPKDAAENIPPKVPVQLRNPGTAEPAPAPSKGGVEKRKHESRVLSAVHEPQLAPAPLAPEQKASSTWDCQPTPTGTIVCKPPGKKPVAAEVKTPAVPPAKSTAPSPSNAPQQPQAPSASSQVWDCQPKPPSGEVVCRPVGAAP